MNSSSESMMAVEAGVTEGLLFWLSKLAGLALPVVSVVVDSLLRERRSEDVEVAFREPWAAFGSGSSLSVIAASAAFLLRVLGFVVNEGGGKDADRGRINGDDTYRTPHTR